MKLEYYSAEKLKSELLEIVRKYLGPDNYRIFFFGSRVAGNHDPRSDIDIGIEGPSPIPLEIMARIRSAVEEIPTLYHIDIVDFGMVDEGFRKVAKEHIEVFG